MEMPRGSILADPPVRLSGQQLSEDDLKYIGEPLKQFGLSTEKPVNRIFEAFAFPQLIQTVAVTIAPVAIPLLKAIGTVILGEVAKRAVAKFQGEKEPHEFMMDFTVNGIQARVVAKSKDKRIIDDAMKGAYAKFDKSIELMSKEKSPADVLGYGIELDEKSRELKIRKKTKRALLEYDEKSGTWV